MISKWDRPGPNMNQVKIVAGKDYYIMCDDLIEISQTQPDHHIEFTVKGVHVVIYSSRLRSVILTC